MNGQRTSWTSTRPLGRPTITNTPRPAARRRRNSSSEVIATGRLGLTPRASISATLINPSVVLAAAHCVVHPRTRKPYSAGSFGVVLGRRDLHAADGQEIAVRAIRVMPRRSRTKFRDDAALLVLAQPSFLPTARILTPDVQLYAGETARAMGWGQQADASETRSSTRMAVDLQLRSMRACRRYSDRDTPYDPDSMICAGSRSGGHDTCFGDSGGPLMMQRKGVWKLVGIVSNGHGCGRPNHPGYYASVSSPRLYSWIVQETNRVLDAADPGV